jgi:hypothetical protein
MPSLDQPPLLINSVKTKSGVLRGARRMSGMERQKKKMTWQRPPINWIAGRSLIPYTFPAKVRRQRACTLVSSGVPVVAVGGDVPRQEESRANAQTRSWGC